MAKKRLVLSKMERLQVVSDIDKMYFALGAGHIVIKKARAATDAELVKERDVLREHYKSNFGQTYKPGKSTDRAW